MKDYLIQFGSDGRRKTTYASGVHYYVDKQGNVTDGSIKVQDLVDKGFIFVNTNDYNNLLGNNSEHKEYCRQSDGTFAPYIPPEPTAEEKKAAERAALETEYNSNKQDMLTALQAALLAGNDAAASSIKQDYKDMTEAYKTAVKEVG